MYKKECNIKRKNKKSVEYIPIDMKDFMNKYGKLFRIASLYEVMGPNYKDIVWVGSTHNMRPLTLK